MSDNITLPRATVQQALEALENSSPDQYPEDAGVYYDAKDALRTALEQQQQQAEPVAWRYHPVSPFKDKDGLSKVSDAWKFAHSAICGMEAEPLYTSPPQRKPLPDELEAAFKDGWQSAKAAHGIKEPKL